jgi:hypothetical protein
MNVGCKTEDTLKSIAGTICNESTETQGMEIRCSKHIDREMDGVK